MNRIFESFLNRSPSITSRRRQSRGSLLSDSLQTFENRQLLTGAFLPADPAPAAAVSEVVESQGAAMPKFVSTLGPRDTDNSFAEATDLGDVGGDPTDGTRVSVLGKVKAKNDVADYYSFTVGYPGMYRISLTGLRRDVDMELLQSTGSATATLIKSDIKAGIDSESFDDILGPGTYFIRTSMAANEKGTTRYQINISNIGNSYASAFDLGTDPASPINALGYLSSTDTHDVYQVTLNTKTAISINWGALDNALLPNSCTVTLFQVSTTSTLTTQTGALGPITQTGLTPGVYLIFVKTDLANVIGDPLDEALYGLTVTVS